jgi:hypothetical protein
MMGGPLSAVIAPREGCGCSLRRPVIDIMCGPPHIDVRDAVAVVPQQSAAITFVDRQHSELYGDEIGDLAPPGTPPFIEADRELRNESVAFLGTECLEHVRIRIGDARSRP